MCGEPDADARRNRSRVLRTHAIHRARPWPPRPAMSGARGGGRLSSRRPVVLQRLPGSGATCRYAAISSGRSKSPSSVRRKSSVRSGCRAAPSPARRVHLWKSGQGTRVRIGSRTSTPPPSSARGHEPVRRGDPPMIHPLDTWSDRSGVTGADSLEEQFGSGPSASRGPRAIWRRAPCTSVSSSYDGSPLWTRGRDSEPLQELVSYARALRTKSS